MTLTFPLSLANLADLLPVQNVTFEPGWRQEMTGLGTGELLVADLGPQMWTAAVVLRPMPHTQARGIKGRLEALHGSLEAFYLYDCTNAYPTRDPGGTILGASTVTVLSIGSDNKSLSLAGLPPGYVLENDMLAIDYGGSPSRRALLRMIGEVTAGADGHTVLFEVRPFLRPGLVAGAPVSLKKPAAKMVLEPGTLDYAMAGNRTSISFRARQTLRAG